MLGVGFGRGHMPGTNVQQRNVFVNIKAMETGAMRRGYVISPEGIRLGLSGRSLGPKLDVAEETQSPFRIRAERFGRTSSRHV